MKRALCKHGFTLVELLVVITIIGILIALLLPAVQAAREAARQTQCKNHLKQIALACISHEEATGRFPTGGWGYCWTGDPDRGTNWRQPGGWIYNILPHIEQQQLYDMGAGMAWNSAEKKLYNLQRMATPLSVLYCPSRRAAVAYPWNNTPGAAGGNAANGAEIVNAGMPTIAGRSDYAANGGGVYTAPNAPVSPLWTNAQGGNNAAGPASITEVENPPGQMTSNARTTFANIASAATGIVYVGSLTSMADVSDGTSKTYLVGEKYLVPDYYETGICRGDNENAFMGNNADISRWTFVAPLPDTPGYVAIHQFGSAHSNGFHMALCDGSVTMINYSIDPLAHYNLGNRKDGFVIDGNAF